MTADHAHHDHHHHHHNGLTWGFALTLAFAAVEATAGWYSHSLALLGDAGHMVTDATALGLAALAARFARRPPSSRHSYGLGRIEVVAALLNSLFMVALVVGIAAAAWDRLQAPQPVEGAVVMLVATAGLLINAGIAWALSRGHATLNTRAALLHVVGDMLGSVAALISGVVIYFTGWMPIDALLSLLICAIILYSALRLLREALHVILEGVPHELSLAEVGAAITDTAGVSSVHDLHVWTLSSGRVMLSAHVRVHHIERWGETLRGIQAMLNQRYGIDHVTLQPESADANAPACTACC